MNRNDPLAALNSLELLAGCTRRELELAAALLTELTIPPGEVLVRQDSVGREFMIVAEGELSVTRVDADGAEVVDVVRAGAVVGEMALLHRVARSATVTTLTQARVYAGNSREFFALLDAIPSAADRIIATAQQRADANRAA